MSAAELRRAAEYAALRGETVLAGLLTRASFHADEAEHSARVTSDQAMTHIEPNYAPLVSDAIALARVINDGAL